MLSDQELRLECLKLAVEAGPGAFPPVSEAEKMFNFVRGPSGGHGDAIPIDGRDWADSIAEQLARDASRRPQDLGIPS